MPTTSKQAVLLVGSGYGALKVAEDLAQSGIAVVWVTKSHHFLELPGGIKSFTEWPDDLNFQFRPLYLRVTRNPLVTPLTNSRIESLEKVEDGFRIKVVQNPQYVDYDLCTGCGKCMEVCPLSESDHPPLTRTPNYCPSRALELDKRKLSDCRVSCPLGVNAQAYMALAAVSRFDEALAEIRKDNPLPGICGRVCHHPCEETCRRTELEQAVAIRDVKRFLADYEVKNHAPKLDMPDAPKRQEKVAVIGSGPAGLTAAHFLNRVGFPVTVFESMPQAGGMLRAGINAFRLPRAVLDAEIQAIVDTGVEIRTGTEINSISKLFKQGFKAVLLCTGTHRDLRLNIPGEDLDGVVHCVKFLNGVNLYQTGEVGARTVVIGAGNSAMDAARTALRLGAEEVTVLAIEKADQMPVHPREVREAAEEGVQFKLGAAPMEFEGEGDQVRRIVCRPAHWSEPDSKGAICIVYDSEETFALEADTVIVSIGQQPHLEECGLAKEVETGRGSRVEVDKKSCTSKEGVFAAGDVVSGPSSVIGAMADGRRAAGKVIQFLTGKRSPFQELTAESRGVGDYLEISEDIPRKWRPEMAQRQPKKRRRDFDEVDFGFTPEQAVAEAKRCLQCGSCCECRICEDVCTDIGAIDHFRPANRIDVSAPELIVTDRDELPDESILEDKNVQYIGDFPSTTNLMNVLVAGSAIAGKSMAGASQLRTETAMSEILSHSRQSEKMNDSLEDDEVDIPPSASRAIEAAAEMRLGVFLCTCNGTMAPAGTMEIIREYAACIPGVEHSEFIFSVCHPKGANLIARAVKERSLNRVIVASCVCCPLEFQCISCNDQRTRARIHLFDRLGLDRSRFEMLDIKDHLLKGEESEGEIFERARDLMRLAYTRARFLEPLRQGTTEIGKRILILGGSEIGLSCALNLELQGFKVRLVHNAWIKDQAKPKKSRIKSQSFTGVGKNIQHVKDAEIEEIRGHVGDFTVVMKEEGVLHRRHPDIICLTDESVLPLAIHEDMMGLKKLYRYNFKFFHTPQIGIFRVMPRTLDRVNSFEAGTALAALVASTAAEAFLKDHELSPRIDPELCRGCGRCDEICPFNAIKMVADSHGIFTAEVVRHNCVGCGGCVGRCPVTAMDMPYFSNQWLREGVEDVLAGER